MPGFKSGSIGPKVAKLTIVLHFIDIILLVLTPQIVVIFTILYLPICFFTYLRQTCKLSIRLSSLSSSWNELQRIDIFIRFHLTRINKFFSSGCRVLNKWSFWQVGDVIISFLWINERGLINSLQQGGIFGASDLIIIFKAVKGTVLFCSEVVTDWILD